MRERAGRSVRAEARHERLKRSVVDVDDVRDWPRAELQLPDGQRVRVRVTRCRPDRQGRYWYDYALELPTRLDDRRHRPSPTAYLSTRSTGGGVVFRP